MTQRKQIRAKVITQVKYLREAIAAWREEEDIDSGDIWIHLRRDEMLGGVIGHWCEILEEPMEHFPWRDEFVAYVYIDVRKGDRKKDNGQ